MLATLTAFLASPIFGSVTGVVGGWLTKREGRLAQIEKNKHDQEMARLSLEETRLEGELNLRVTETEGDIARDVAAGEAFTEGQKGAFKTYGIKWVDTILGLIRPFLTVYVMVWFTYLSINISIVVGGLHALSTETLNEVYIKIIMAVIYLANTGFCWWFSARPPQERKG